MPSYYEVLGVSQNATQTEIQRAYRELVKKHHPDRNPADAESATKTTQLINEAYNTLKDPVKRSEYDISLALSARQRDVFDSDLTADEPGSADEEPYIAECRCERCGRMDPSLRATIFLWVLSLLVVSIRRGWGGVLCSKCRLRYSILFNVEVWLLGWWGLPWGVIWSIEALVRNSIGGIQPKDGNAALLALVSYQLYCQGRYAEALDAGSRSLEFQPNQDLQAFLDEIRPYAQFRNGDAEEKHKGRILVANLAVAVLFILAGLAGYSSITQSSRRIHGTTVGSGRIEETREARDEYKEVAPEAVGNLELVEQSRRECEEALRRIAEHLEQRLPVAQVSHQPNRIIYHYQADYTKLDGSVIESYRETIQHELQEAEGYARLAKEKASSLSPEERAKLSSALEEDLSFIAAACFNARVLEAGARVFGELDRSGGIPEDEVRRLEHVANRYRVRKWLTDSAYLPRFAELLKILKATADDLKALKHIQPGLQALKRQIEADQASIQQIQSRLELLYASGQVEAYNLLVDRHNALVRRYRGNASAFNARVIKANRILEKLKQMDLNGAFTDCLDDRVIFQQFDDESSTLE